MKKLRTQIIRIGIYIGKLFLNIIYFLMKICPSKNKVIMLSRQSDRANIDFEFIEQEIKKRTKKVQIKILCKVIRKDMKSRFLYCFYMLKCMYHIATSKVCILDGYSVPISILKHKKKLIIIQIWHASGAIKKFGYQALNKKEGRGNSIAKVMNMHKNYTYVLAASHATGDLFSEAFRISKDKIVLNALPRIDYLIDENITKQKIKQFYKEYPKYKNKKIILYVPTFRKDKDNNSKELIKNIENEKYKLIIKLHPLDKTQIDFEYKINKKYNTYDLLKIADYIITDYSALAFDAALLNKPLYFYVYDINDYEIERGLNIDLFKEMSNCTSRNIKEIIKSIENNEYDYEELEKFRNKYMENVNYNNTEKLVEFIFKCLDKDAKNEEDKNSADEYSKEKLNI